MHEFSFSDLVQVIYKKRKMFLIMSTFLFLLLMILTYFYGFSHPRKTVLGVLAESDLNSKQYKMIEEIQKRAEEITHFKNHLQIMNDAQAMVVYEKKFAMRTGQSYYANLYFTNDTFPLLMSLYGKYFNDFNIEHYMFDYYSGDVLANGERQLVKKIDQITKGQIYIILSYVFKTLVELPMLQAKWPKDRDYKEIEMRSLKFVEKVEGLFQKYVDFLKTLPVQHPILFSSMALEEIYGLKNPRWAIEHYDNYKKPVQIKYFLKWCTYILLSFLSATFLSITATLFFGFIQNSLPEVGRQKRRA